MTPQERDLVLGLFQRLKPPPAGEIDAEARDFIDQLGRQQPMALYLLAQTTLVQEHALKGAEAKIADLEAKLTQEQQAPPPAPRRSFLSGLLGGDQPNAQTRPAYATTAPAAMAAPSMPSPWGARSAPSFMQSALSTAAGVAGGALLFQGIEHLLGYGGSPFATAGYGGTPGLAQPVEEVVVNNYDTPAPQDASNTDPGFDNTDPGNDPSLNVTPVDDPGSASSAGSAGGDDGSQSV
jgi:hypothetical protein